MIRTGRTVVKPNRGMLAAILAGTTALGGCGRDAPLQPDIHSVSSPSATTDSQMQEPSRRAPLPLDSMQRIELTRGGVVEAVILYQRLVEIPAAASDGEASLERVYDFSERCGVFLASGGASVTTGTGGTFCAWRQVRLFLKPNGDVVLSGKGEAMYEPMTLERLNEQNRPAAPVRSIPLRGRLEVLSGR